MSSDDEASSSLNSLLNKYKIPIGLSLVGLVLIVGGVFATSAPINTEQASYFPKESIVKPTEEYIVVDISGAVKKSGVYKIAKDSRLEDVVNAAGGLGADVNQEYISKYLNMAQKLSDGMKIYIPFEGEQGIMQAGSSAGGVAGVSTTPGKINVNSSSQSELEALSGVGPVTASKIISGRPYQKIEDLLNNKVVSKSVFEKIKDSLVLY
jgi:competence protein ComEA